MSLTNKDASLVLGMAARGDKKHDIAAWFGENQARIKEIEDGAFGSTVTAAPTANLPPKGAPGPKGRRLRSKTIKAVEALQNGNASSALALLQEGLNDFNRNE